MNKDYYVILTGSKNNAGDFLIKYRAKQLFKEIRSDRKIVDYNAWEYLTDDKLDIINNSKALILMGGPALQKHMYPGIYKLRKNLDDIKVPIIMMGIGWKSTNGEWKDTYNYPLNNSSLLLLQRIDNSGYLSSVRDYHTLNVLEIKGFKNFIMTGCPAYYDKKYLKKDLNIPKTIKKIAFSLGVSFVSGPSMEKLMKDNILVLKNYFRNKDFEVVFHHSLDKEKLLTSGSAIALHNRKHREFAKWLEQENIKYVDISGSAENLINYYSNVDLHIGYRVHAHIFMNSVSKLSILISEDGRAKAVNKVIGGIVLDGYPSFKEGFIYKVLGRLGLYDRFEANNFLSQEIINNIKYEEKINFIRIKNSRQAIDNNFKIIEKFLKQLP